MKTAQHLALATAVILSLALSAQAAGPYRVIDLGDLPGGEDVSSAFDINNRGEVVGWSRDATGWVRAFHWSSDDGMQNLGILPGHLFNEAWGINDAGQVVGFGGANSNAGAFLWTSANGMQPGGLRGAYDVNEAGQIVGNTAADVAALWTSTGGVQSLGVLPGHLNSRAWAINEAGDVVGQSYPESRAFLWTSTSGMQELGVLPGGNASVAWHINNAGQIVGNSSAATGSRAFLWTSERGMQDLGVLPTAELSFSQALGINDSGEAVGWSNAGQSTHAFLWTSADGMQDLNSLLDEFGAGWTLLEASAINNSGQIVGYGNNPAGQQHAFLLTPVPEPSTLAIGGCAVLLVAMNWLHRCRRRRSQTKLSESQCVSLNANF